MEHIGAGRDRFKYALDIMSSRSIKWQRKPKWSSWIRKR
jgi:hypothetical protein